MKLNYVKHKIVNLIPISKIVTMHYYEFDKTFSFAGESHNFWEMVYVDTGQVDIRANHKDYQLKQGDIIFHKPNEFHTLKSGNNAAANVFVISFVCSSEAMNFFKGKSLNVPTKLRRYVYMLLEEYLQTFQSMSVEDIQLELKENPPIGGQQMIKTLLEQFLILLIRNESESQNLRLFPSKESMENHLVSQMMHFIDDNLYSNLPVEKLCKEFNYSRAYLSKIFKDFSGYTILEYINAQKIREAKKLIRDGNYNFTQISDMLAFDNPHYFSRVFKRITDMTPSDYKKSSRRL